MLLFCDGAHRKAEETVVVELRVHVALIEVQAVTVRIGVRASRPIVAVGTDAVQRLPVMTVASSREKNGVPIGFAGYAIAKMTVQRCPSPCALV